MPAFVAGIFFGGACAACVGGGRRRGARRMKRGSSWRVGVSATQRSAAAAKDIRVLIAESSRQVADGSLLVGRAGRTMDGVIDSVQRVSRIVAEISAASAEQSAGIELVNRAVTHMDEGTQQNAALVEEAAASTQSLAERAAALARAVAAFRIEAEPEIAPPARVHARRRAVDRAGG